MKKIIISMMFLMLIIPLVLGAEAESEIFDEDFEYPGELFESNGWTESQAGTDFNSTPIWSPDLNSYAFGLNHTNPYSNSRTITLSQAFPSNVSDTMSIEFHATTINNTGTGVTQSLAIWQPADDVDRRFIVRFVGNGSLQTSSLRTGSESCDYNGGSEKYYYIVNVNFDFQEATYSIYVNGSLVCDEYDFNYTSFNAGRIAITQSYQDNEYEQHYLDDIYISGAGFLGVGYDEYEPCETDEDCASGKCVGNICVLKDFYETCTDGSECLSGVCINNKCGKASLSQVSENMKNQIFGKDSTSSNIFSLILMISIALIIIYFGKGSTVSVTLAVVSFVALTFLFAFMGWLSAWIVIGIIVIFLIIMIIGVVIARGG